MQHKLKTWPVFFKAVRSRKKLFEVRVRDRPYSVGDTLLLQEYDPGAGYTGQECEVSVLFILGGGQFGVEKECCVMSIRLIDYLPVTASAERIIRGFCDLVDVSFASLTAQNRRHEIVAYRQALIYFLKQHTRMAITEIGRVMKRDHTSVLHSLKRVQDLLDTEAEYGLWLESINPMKTIESDNQNDNL